MSDRTTLLLLSLSLLLGGCAGRCPDVSPVTSVLVRKPQTIPEIGAGQGIAMSPGEDAFYLYGDAETGIVRGYLVHEGGVLYHTGRTVRLTRNGEDLVAHPTGLAIQRGMPAFIGETIERVGTIYVVDWNRALASGTLDHAVLNVVEDDDAIDGTRPCYVRIGNRWLVATSDYGRFGNEVRLLDPEKLATAKKTSDPGVIVHRFPCGPFVQSLVWMDEERLLVLVQNTERGRGYRLSFASFAEEEGALSMCDRGKIDFPGLTTQLEGCAPLGDGNFLLLSAYPRNNVRIVSLESDLFGGRSMAVGVGRD